MCSCRACRRSPGCPSTRLRIDRRLGLNTAAFVIGYQGSPVGTFTEELERANRTVPDLPIVVQPGVNEELAATAVMGSQLAITLDDCQVRRRPRHLVRQGPRDSTAAATRSVTPCSPARRRTAASSPSSVTTRPPSRRRCRRRATPPWSTSTCRSCFPATSQEALDLSRHAVALSRSCGLWSGLKLVTAVADGTGTDRRAPRPGAARHPRRRRRRHGRSNPARTDG